MFCKEIKGSILTMNLFLRHFRNLGAKRYFPTIYFAVARVSTAKVI